MDGRTVLISLQFDWLPRERKAFGALAQLGEHLLCKQGVVGSIPTGSTIGQRFGRPPRTSMGR